VYEKSNYPVKIYDIGTTAGRQGGDLRENRFPLKACGNGLSSPYFAEVSRFSHKYLLFFEDCADAKAGQGH
jgi:hypothetical protein